MSRIFWDTNLFIYLIEDFGELSARVVRLRERMLARGDQLLTSTLTLGEVLAKPIEKGDEGLARQYEAALVRGAVLVSFDQAEDLRLVLEERIDLPLVHLRVLLEEIEQGPKDVVVRRRGLVRHEQRNHFAVPFPQVSCSTQKHAGYRRAIAQAYLPSSSIAM